MLAVSSIPDSTRFTITVEPPAGNGVIESLDAHSCIHLAIMLARAGRGAGATWPDLYPDDIDQEVLAGLKAACGEPEPLVVEHSERVVEELRDTIQTVHRKVAAAAEALSEMEKIVNAQ